jgi:hypothetical protein
LGFLEKSPPPPPPIKITPFSTEAEYMYGHVREILVNYKGVL